MILLEQTKVLPETDRGKVKAAFADLRKRGYACRMNFMCCGNCANTGMHELYPDKNHVYWHRQNDDAFYEGNLTSTLYLHWSGDGYEIAAVLRDWGLVVEWNGSEHRCIEVLNSTAEEAYA
jgi:hypothetical protein